MAILTPNELAELRRGLAKDMLEVTWDKTAANGAYQAIEDFFETNRAAFASAIGPGFSGPQKKKIVALWMLQKPRREGVL